MELKNTKLYICRKCLGTGRVHGGDENSTWSKSCEDCRGIGFVRVPKTNADRIRDMTDEELAEFLVSVENRRRGNGCGAIWHLPHVALEWLQQPAEGEST